MTRASGASSDSKIAEEKEQIALAYDASMSDNYEKGNYTTGVTSTQMKDYLEKQGQDVDVNGDTKISVTFNKTKNTYTVDGKTGVIEGPSTGSSTPTVPENPEGIKWMHEQDENGDAVITGIDLSEYSDFEKTKITNDEEEGYMNNIINLRH